MTFLTLLLDGIQWADKAVENLDFLDVFAIDLFRSGYQNLVNQLMQNLIVQFGDTSVLVVRNPVLQGWYPNSDSGQTGVHPSSSPTYPVHAVPNPSIKLE